MGVAATASVGETIAPRTKAAAQGRPGMSACATAAIPAVVVRTRPTASRAIGRRLATKSRQEVNQPAA